MVNGPSVVDNSEMVDSSTIGLPLVSLSSDVGSVCGWNVEGFLVSPEVVRDSVVEVSSGVVWSDVSPVGIVNIPVVVSDVVTGEVVCSVVTPGQSVRERILSYVFIQNNYILVTCDVY